MTMRWRFALALGVLLSLPSCGDNTPWQEYNAGAVKLRVNASRLLVEQECMRRGAAVQSTDEGIAGCCDFKNAVLVSIPDLKVVAHEFCHWTLQTASHEVCPPPLL